MTQDTFFEDKSNFNKRLDFLNGMPKTTTSPAMHYTVPTRGFWPSLRVPSRCPPPLILCPYDADPSVCTLTMAGLTPCLCVSWIPFQFSVKCGLYPISYFFYLKHCNTAAFPTSLSTLQILPIQHWSSNMWADLGKGHLKCKLSISDQFGRANILLSPRNWRFYLIFTLAHSHNRIDFTHCVMNS